MRIEFHTDGQVLAAGLREFTEATVRRAFGRFASRVRGVRVYLWDVNGPRGGDDKGVRLVVELAPWGDVLVREVDANAFAAVTAAVMRARRAVREELRRRWTRRRRQAQGERAVRHRRSAPLVGD